MSGYCECSCGPSSGAGTGSCRSLKDFITFGSVPGVGEIQKYEEAMRSSGVLDASLGPDARPTVFAWTDAAFSAFLADSGAPADAVTSDVNLIKFLIAYSISAQPLPTLEGAGQVPTLLEQRPGAPLPLTVEGAGAGLRVCGAACAKLIASIDTCEAIVHVVDRVLVPPRPPK